MISPKDFVERWERAELREQQAAQSHFIELCQLVGQQTPTQADPEGKSFTFEQHVTKEGGGAGRADVWLKGNFAWEYKGKLKDLDAAYTQLLAYRSDLDNPPLLVVSDLLEYRIYPQFPNLSGQPIKFTNRDLLEQKTRDFILWLLTDPEKFRQYLEQQRKASEALTEKLAHEFAELAGLMREHPGGGKPPRWDSMQIARFLTKLVFALFAEDVGLMPEPFNQPVFRYLVEGARHVPESFAIELTRLFEAMNGLSPQFVSRLVPYFDGGLFNNSAEGLADGLEVLDITEIPGAIDLLDRVAERDWRKVDPTIFGNLFEGALDENKRAQLGAHYTKETDIRLVIDPVLMAPVLREWEAVRAEAEPLLQVFLSTATSPRDSAQAEARLKTLRDGFNDRLAALSVLDPACGSGNFLYVSLKALKTLEGEVRKMFHAVEPGYFRDVVTPRQFFGIEKDPFAARLAHVVLWIGYLQWRYEDEGILHWYQSRKARHPRELPHPIIDDRDAPDAPPRILNDDAILRHDADGTPYEPAWPPAEVIVGNPPFLGDKSMRFELGDDYTETLRKQYSGRVPGGADLVTYWFEKARGQIEAGHTRRAGLISTNSIRGGANRVVLERIKQSGDIFMAWSDNKWSLGGAAVRISIVGFGQSDGQSYELNGRVVEQINPDLTSQTAVSEAETLIDNANLGYIGVSQHGPFEISEQQANVMFQASPSNSKVVSPIANSFDVMQRFGNRWVVDFPPGTSLEQAQSFSLPFRYVEENILPVRKTNNRKQYRDYWWIHGEGRPAMRKALAPLSRYVLTPRVSKHRVFVWMSPSVLPSDAVVAIARDDDYFFGVLHAYLHETWSLRLGTWLGKGNDPRYTPTTTFETFPFPFTPGQEDFSDPRIARISAAAAQLHAERDAWLNPRDLLALDLTRDSKEIRERTLTNLYNAAAAIRGAGGKAVKLVESARLFAPRLVALHNALDSAVLAAYGWSDLDGRLRSADGDEELLRRLLAENQRRAAGG